MAIPHNPLFPRLRKIGFFLVQAPYFIGFIVMSLPSRAVALPAGSNDQLALAPILDLTTVKSNPQIKVSFLNECGNEFQGFLITHERRDPNAWRLGVVVKRHNLQCLGAPTRVEKTIVASKALSAARILPLNIKVDLHRGILKFNSRINLVSDPEYQDRLIKFQTNCGQFVGLVLQPVQNNKTYFGILEFYPIDEQHGSCQKMSPVLAPQKERFTLLPNEWLSRDGRESTLLPINKQNFYKNNLPVGQKKIIRRLELVPVTNLSMSADGIKASFQHNCQQIPLGLFVSEASIKKGRRGIAILMINMDPSEKAVYTQNQSVLPCKSDQTDQLMTKIYRLKQIHFSGAQQVVSFFPFHKTSRRQIAARSPLTLDDHYLVLSPQVTDFRGQLSRDRQIPQVSYKTSACDKKLGYVLSQLGDYSALGVVISRCSKGSILGNDQESWTEESLSFLSLGPKKVIYPLQIM